MTQLSSLSGKLILQQPFKWPLHLQSLPRQSTHPVLPARFIFLPLGSTGVSLLPPQEVKDQAANPHGGIQGPNMKVRLISVHSAMARENPTTCGPHTCALSSCLHCGVCIDTSTWNPSLSHPFYMPWPSQHKRHLPSKELPLTHQYFICTTQSPHHIALYSLS